MIRMTLLSVSMIILSTSAYAEINEKSDGCESQGQACVCSNTGRGGECDSEFDIPGLYCHCDDHSTATKNENSDGCENMSQVCTCGGTGWSGTCGLGSAKAGLYCHCGDISQSNQGVVGKFTTEDIGKPCKLKDGGDSTVRLIQDPDFGPVLACH